ncbi:cation:proton antiporter domain-containing protein [Roseimarinus sediminis]|uniref:cation:proton antiporter domain-containing protein n=1 Tax=Roseimarinus sediminis TaxID=1610899 RepID=UPI003D2564F2
MELSLLKDIVVIFALSTFVNLIFTKLKIPTIVGYLLTGVIAGPHLLKMVEEQHQIEILAEIGVVLLLFSIGLEFSLKHLLRIRKVVFLGGFMQVALTALVFFGISRFYDMNWKSGLFIGFVAALSSSALVLKVLQERSELSSNYGRTVLGILIFQDIMLVPLLLFSDFLGPEALDLKTELFELLLKTIGIIAFVYVGNKWLFPWLLRIIAFTRNQELFMMSILLFCLAIALMTSELGMSLAFGAFLAGLMISESEYSHNAFGSLIPFKDTFTSFFFVSVGMLLDLNFVLDHAWMVAGTVALILIIKAIFAGATGFVLGHTFKGTVMVGLALSQVGEFSFILAKIGVEKAIISSFYYQLFLSVAVITMSVSPFIIKLAPGFANFLLKLPLPKVLVEGLFPLVEVEVPAIENHTVFIGKDPVALKLSKLSKYVKLPYVSIVFDPMKVKELQKAGESVIYGDAVNEPILQKAFVDKAEIVVVSVGDMITSLAIIEKVRTMNKRAYILVRAKNINDIEQLFEVGADQVFPENFEIAIDLFGRIMNHRLMPDKEINLLLGKIRNDFYGVFRDRDNKNQPGLLDELPNLEIAVYKITDDSLLVGKTLAELSLRKNVGITLVAIQRGKDLIENPGSNNAFETGDVLYFLGKPGQIAYAYDYFSAADEKG